MAHLAIVWTRPETVREDVARVLALAGLAPSGGGPLEVVPLAADRPEPGRDTAPWLVEAVRAAFAADGDSEPAPRPDDPARDVLHLTVARLDPALGVGGCLQALAGAARPDVRGERASPVRAVVAGARDALAAPARHGFLIDATLVPGSLRPDAALRPSNLLLAGRDPVALDAAAARVLGLEPASLPLLSLAAAAGLGEISPDPSRLVGDAGELDRRPLSPWRPTPAGAVARLWRRAWRRCGRRARGEDGDTPWHALWRACTPEPLSRRGTS